MGIERSEILRHRSILQDSIGAAREQVPPQFRSPELQKQVIVRPPHCIRFNTDGTPNAQVHLRGSGVTFNADTGISTLFFEGIRPVFRNPPHGHRQNSAIFAARSADNWQTVTFFDPTDQHIADRTQAQPIVESIEPRDVSLHGQQDPRITRFGRGSVLDTYVTIVNTTNIVTKMRGLDAIDRDLERVLAGGAQPEVYLMSDVGNPSTYEALGALGPNEHFKNVVLFPEVIEQDGKPQILFFGRRFPNIQAFTIPVADINKFLYSQTYRSRYWSQHLASEYLADNTVLQPEFGWEGVDPARGIKGQIAGGAPPIKVSIPDESGQQGKDAWLFIYNATPAFDTDNNGIGRVVGATLLDFKDPRKVLSRSPMPIIWPTQGKELEGGIYDHTTFASGAYIDNENTLRIFYAAGDSEIAMASCPANEMLTYLSRFDARGNLIQQ